MYFGIKGSSAMSIFDFLLLPHHHYIIMYYSTDQNREQERKKLLYEYGTCTHV